MGRPPNSKSKPPPPPPSEEQLRERREALRLSRRTIADETELSVSRVWASEHPDGGITDEERRKIVNVLNDELKRISSLPPLAV